MRAKKSLGQNFLKNQSIAAKIAESASLSRQDTVLEIGPGTGMLTRELLARAGKVVAIEKDEHLAEELRNTFQEECADETLVVIEGDILEMDEGMLPNEYKIVANIPYYITGAIIKKFLTAHVQPTTMVLLVQKEVADRIVARDGKESMLSISVKAYGKPHYVSTVKAGSFVPAPKVDSAVLAIENISRACFADKKEEGRFFELLRAGFGQKRKLLIRNLESVLSKEAAGVAFAACNINTTVRAERLTADHWLCFSKTTRKN